MQFIGKDNKKYKTRGHDIIHSFIDGCWQNNSNKYVNLGYDELKRNENFNDLLLEEQKGFCCYCMRKIPVNKLTLEHVMPRNIKTDIANEVKHYYQFISPQRVQYLSQINPNNKLKYPPYPHCIAYENLTASCDGSIYEEGGKYRLHACCNNKRENEKIIPLFFLPRIHYILIYEEDGRLTYTEEYDSTIKSLNLDCNSLRLIRKVWACIRNNNVKIADVRAAEKDKSLRKDIIVQLGLDRTEESNIKNDLYWELLLQFHWFYGYFGLKYLGKNK
jgi:hypothetical protein